MVMVYYKVESVAPSLFKLPPSYSTIYNKVESVAQSVSNLAIQFGDSDDEVGIMSRPFGVALLFAG